MEMSKSAEKKTGPTLRRRQQLQFFADWKNDELIEMDENRNRIVSSDWRSHLWNYVSDDRGHRRGTSLGFGFTFSCPYFRDILSCDANVFVHEPNKSFDSFSLSPLASKLHQFRTNDVRDILSVYLVPTF